jgi:hypothetical protein
MIVALAGVEARHRVFVPNMFVQQDAPVPASTEDAEEEFAPPAQGEPNHILKL